MSRFTIAVLSDLHIGPRARGKDLCPHTNTKAVEEDYLNRFISFIQTKRISADYLVIPGDISDSAHIDEFRLASKIIQTIAEKLQIPTDHIVFVPGNHDLTLGAQTPDCLDIKSTHDNRYINLMDDHCGFANIIKCATPYLLTEPHFCSWEFDNLLVVGYNSSWHYNISTTDDQGMFDRASAKELKDHLNNLDLSTKRVKLFIVHHHSMPHSDFVDPHNVTTKISPMVNADKLLALLVSKNFDLIINGHKHSPYFNTYSVSSSSPIAILSSGSFSAWISPFLLSILSNQFHLIYIDGRNETDGCILGNIVSWAYDSINGWKESEPRDGIIHKYPFGTHLHPNVVISQLRPVIQKKLGKRDWTSWEAIISGLPHLKHYPPERILEVLNTLSTELHFAIRQDSAGIILLREESSDE